MQTLNPKPYCAVPDKEEGKALAAAAEAQMRREEAAATKQDVQAREQELQVPAARWELSVMACPGTPGQGHILPVLL